MPTFVATYLKPNGARRTERIEAIDRGSLELYLRHSRKVHIIEVAEAIAWRWSWRAKSKTGHYTYKIKAEVLLAMLDSLEILLSAGVTISVALRALVERTPPGRYRLLWSELASQVETDGKLGPAMRRFPNIFSEAACGMVEAGESTGALDDAIGKVRSYIEQIDEVQRAGKRAAFYPATVMFFGVLSMSVLMIFTLPKFSAMIKEMNVKNLNVISKVFFAMSDVISAHVGLAGATVVLLPALVVVAVKSKACRRLLDRLGLRVPKVSSMLWSLCLARICPTFAGLYKQGVPADQCLPLCERVAGNSVIAKLVADVGRLVRENVEIGTAFERVGGFPLEIVLAVKSGSGQLDKVMARMGSYYAGRSKYQVEMALKVLEPVLTVMVVGFAGLTMLAMFLPLASIVQGIR